MSPLCRYWLGPCCEDPDHHVNYNDKNYLGDLGKSVLKIREFLRDFAYMKRVRRYRILCPNRMIGIGDSEDASLDELRVVASRWGEDPVHPAEATYKLLADELMTEMGRDRASYSNSETGNDNSSRKRKRVDLAEQRQPWISGCSAALPRNDSFSPGGGAGRNRGQRGWRGGRHQRGPHWSTRGRGMSTGRGGRGWSERGNTRGGRGGGGY